ncbi:hypothetical protein J2S73_002844 [Amorphus orientalis]|uniref:Uncharacterized protein n=1 Tax=Amorphus orientalis TaxID=649198 RepID=A0AAE3VQQ3_9HYPH|nr:hypothetical protein [Amorphus orientalis]
MLTDKAIEKAKTTVRYSIGDVLHEHNDCVRIAYEWLDAQTKLKSANRKFRPLKHIIENWGGRYVSQTDVDLAAHLHPDIFGSYPYYNISSKLTRPSARRLSSIGEAGTQRYEEQPGSKTYASSEV